MSVGSGASNLGYGNISPFNNSSYVNGTNSNYSGNFSSNEIPGLPGLAGAQNNINAAAGIVPGICLFKGGAKRLKRKIKNITKRYKMKGGKKGRKSLKRRVKSRALALAGGRRVRRSRQMAMAMAGGVRRPSSRQMSMAMAGGIRRLGSRRMAMAMAGGTRRNRYNTKGGSQYQNNYPNTPSYSVGGILSANELGLANPPPIKVWDGNVNNIDNYNHFTGKGFPSAGH